MLNLDHESDVALVTQITSGLKQLVAQRKLAQGMKVPSIRQFARQHGISPSTVVEAYDRLVAEGVLVARQNTGFFVRSGIRDRQDPRDVATPARSIDFDARWLVRRIWEGEPASIKAGCGWLPESWLDEEAIRRNLRQLANRPDGNFTSYGLPKGLEALRWTISDWLGEHEICAGPESVLLTGGANHALALVTRCLVRPGDIVLVDDPGYSVLSSHLSACGARIVGVPWGSQGPDLGQLEALLSVHKPRTFFTNPRLQNPTGASYSPATAHRVLQLADRHDLTIIEDDVSIELDTLQRRSLASLDQLRRVIYVGSFSKSISPSLRVGFIVGDVPLIEELTAIKMGMGLSSSELTERLTQEILTEGRYRKHLKGLRQRLGEALAQTCHRLEDAGLEVLLHPPAGMFVWARHSAYADAGRLSAAAAEHGILLAPGHLFSQEVGPLPWMRFNAAFCGDPRLYEFLASA
ncbi:MAG TPA: PLP-dependent aminotransferase family protein [Aromatoleum sp.]|uniref:aminotransferase-like domain-containing protein n=1 Tax=Aromatoleum sp. TaxID=2307007 RepID=UPI002B467B22|nr:PLP-dependent aminotransferase family protein [Aromatoleum sp.]HJV25155.1 PLP-dependent aminotransferase family protein [Aromatoleum sp.]